MNPMQSLVSTLTVLEFINLLDERDQKLIEQIADKVRPKNTLPEWMTRKQVAGYLSICLSSVDNYTNKGILTKHYVSGVPRFHRDEVEAVLNQRKNIY